MDKNGVQPFSNAVHVKIAEGLHTKGLLKEVEKTPSFTAYGITERGQKELKEYQKAVPFARKDVGNTGKKTMQYQGSKVTSQWPSTVTMPDGHKFYKGSKKGTNNQTGKPVMEYSDDADDRVWIGQDGTVYGD